MEAGNALEPVVVRAMERAGWKVSAADSQDPQTVMVRIGPNLLVTGHPDRTARMPLDGDEAVSEAATVQMLLFGDEAPGPAHGDPMVVEIKTRGPEAFRRWRTLGAERSHPASVAQAAFYTLGEFGDLRDAAIATMDTGSRTWDYQVIPAQRLERALQDPCERLGELGAHHVQSGPDPDVLPERDFSATTWQCRSCPFLAVCLPGAAEEGKEAETEDVEVSDEEARDAVAAFSEAQESLKEPEKAKRWALDTLKAWMRRRGEGTLGTYDTTYRCKTIELLLRQSFTRDAVSIAVQSMRISLRPTGGFVESHCLRPSSKIAAITVRATGVISRGVRSTVPGTRRRRRQVTGALRRHRWRPFTVSAPSDDQEGNQPHTQ